MSSDIVRVGIFICNRYHTCAGGKCLRSMRNREGAFSLYEGREVELVGYTTCEGCPGGNIEYAPAEIFPNLIQPPYSGISFKSCSGVVTAGV